MYDEVNWLESLVVEIKKYLVSQFSGLLNEGTGGHGLEAYEIVAEFGDSADPPKAAELAKTEIRFEIDDITTTMLGFGQNFTNAVITDGDALTAGSVVEQQAKMHVVNFDVGIWASDTSGGLTSRLRAYQYLDRFLAGELARQRMLTWSDGGIEIKFYRSGRFVTETIDDVRVFRVVGAELEVRVFSRDDADPEILVDQEPTQQPELVIQGDDGSLVDLN